MATPHKFVGARVRRTEDPDLLRGRGRFVDDIHLPGMLEAAFVRSPHAHARIKAIGVSAALAAPGVHAVLAWKDLPPSAQARLPLLVPNPAIRDPRTQYCLAKEEVCFVGDTVAIVVADSRYIAEDAAAMGDVDYDPLPAAAELVDVLEWDPERLRVINPDVGGGFGAKNMFYAEEAVVAAVAVKLNRPVKWIEDPRAHFLATTQEREKRRARALGF